MSPDQWAEKTPLLRVDKVVKRFGGFCALDGASFHLMPGEVLGLSWLFPPYKWRFDGHAVEFVEALAVDGERLRARIDEDPVLGYQVIKRIAPLVLERLQQTRAQLLELYSSGRVAGTS